MLPCCYDDEITQRLTRRRGEIRERERQQKTWGKRNGNVFAPGLLLLRPRNMAVNGVPSALAASFLDRRRHRMTCGARRRHTVGGSLPKERSTKRRNRKEITAYERSKCEGDGLPSPTPADVWPHGSGERSGGRLAPRDARMGAVAPCLARPLRQTRGIRVVRGRRGDAEHPSTSSRRVIDGTGSAR